MKEVGLYEGKACFLEGGWGGLVTEHLPIMQFTGLHDKNGKEIYEGDLVGTKDTTPTAIEYHAPEWVISNQQGWSCPLSHLEIDQEWEVVGNIYENVEKKIIKVRLPDGTIAEGEPVTE